MKSKAVVFSCLLLFVSMVVIVSAVSEVNQEQPDKVEAEKETRHSASAQPNNMNNNVEQDHQDIEASAWRGGGWGGDRWRGGGGGWGGDRERRGGWGGDRERRGGWGGDRGYGGGRGGGRGRGGGGWGGWDGSHT